MGDQFEGWEEQESSPQNIFERQNISGKDFLKFFPVLL
jgi:hypothetical protein